MNHLDKCITIRQLPKTQATPVQKKKTNRKTENITITYRPIQISWAVQNVSKPSDVDFLLWCIHAIKGQVKTDFHQTLPFLAFEANFSSLMCRLWSIACSNPQMQIFSRHLHLLILNSSMRCLSLDSSGTNVHHRPFENGMRHWYWFNQKFRANSHNRNERKKYRSWHSTWKCLHKCAYIVYVVYNRIRSIRFVLSFSRIFLLPLCTFVGIVVDTTSRNIRSFQAINSSIKNAREIKHKWSKNRIRTDNNIQSIDMTKKISFDEKTERLENKLKIIILLDMRAVISVTKRTSAMNNVHFETMSFACFKRLSFVISIRVIRFGVMWFSKQVANHQLLCYVEFIKQIDCWADSILKIKLRSNEMACVTTLSQRSHRLRSWSAVGNGKEAIMPYRVCVMESI